MAQPPATRKTIDAADAARELGVHLGTLVGWCEEGHLRMFVPPGKSLGDGKRGPKGYMIWLVDWEAFKAARTMVGVVRAAEPASPSVKVAAGPATGTDGINRRARSPRRPGGDAPPTGTDGINRLGPSPRRRKEPPKD
jgi:hypothetical protein